LEFPATDPPTRRLLEVEASSTSAGVLHRRLADVDPAAASRIEPANARRTVRALEVAAITGRRFSSFAAAWERYPAGRVRAAGIAVPRDILRRRIERRVAEMIPELVEETRSLLAHGFESFLTSTQAIGYAEAVAFLRGASDEERLASEIVRRTKALARRQMAWLRSDPRSRWFSAGEEGALTVVDQLIEYLGHGSGRPDRPAGREAARTGARGAV